MKQTHTGTLLKQSRKIREISQLDVAKYMGYSSPQFVSNVERGLALLSPTSFRKYSTILEVPVERFVDAYVQDVREAVMIEVGVPKTSRRKKGA